MKLFNLYQEKESDEQCITEISYSNDWLVTVPHSGKLIIDKYKDYIDFNSSVKLSSDLHTERLFDLGKGKFLVFNLLRDFLNVSRAKKGIKGNDVPLHLKQDPLHPMSLTDKKILLKDYSSEEEKEILEIYDEFHWQVNDLIETVKKENDFVLILDGHSLSKVGPKNTPDEGKERASFVLGTLDDTSAHPEIIETFYNALKQSAEEHNWTVKKNSPYKGGFITQKYTDVDNKINIIQLEVNKSIYMDEETLKRDYKQLDIVRDIIKNAMNEAFKKAKALYN